MSKKEENKPSVIGVVGDDGGSGGVPDEEE